MLLFPKKISNNLIFLFILITFSCRTSFARENLITRKIEETITIPDPSIKCDTCPCDTCPEPVPPSPEVPEVVYYSPPPPEIIYSSPPPPEIIYSSPPPPCPPPPSPPPPEEPVCNPCMEKYAPPPPRFSYTPGNDLYVTEYNYNGASQTSTFMGLFVFVGFAFLQLSIIL